MVDLVLVAALDRRNAIGRGNALPWHLPDDLKRFKALTLGRPLLMGRKTAQSLGRALPGRRNLMLTRGDSVPFAGMEAVPSLARALAVAEAKVLAHRAAVEVSSQLFELTGARSTSSRLGLDRFWRNARVHTLHDPVDYKLRALGRHALLGELPEPTAYS